MDYNSRRNLILSYLADSSNGELTNTALAKKIQVEHPDAIAQGELDAWRLTIRRLREKPIDQIKEQVVNVAVTEEKPKYQVINGSYSWESKYGAINLSVDFIDQLFYEYSEHGLNLSQTEIINKHNLQIWEWNSIKSTLWLFKKSNIFSPYTVENTPTDELGEKISSKIRKMLDNTGFQVEQRFNKELNRKYKEVIRKKEEEDLILKHLITELYDLLPECDVHPAIRINTESSGVKNVFIFDLHFGAESRNEKLPKYSPDITRELLMHIAGVVNSFNAKEVNIFFGGDALETVTGGNHFDSWKGIRKGYYGGKVVIECYKLMVDFISSINNVRAVFAVPGNHDRSTTKSDEDNEGIAAELLFELVKLAFKDNLIVKYEPKVVSEKIDGINYIMTHGHFKLTDIHPAELILEYGDTASFNLLVSGHWHERRIKKDTERFRQIVCPSIFPGNDYSVNLGYSTAPGFIIAENNYFNGKPTVIDYSL